MLQETSGKFNHTIYEPPHIFDEPKKSNEDRKKSEIASKDNKTKPQLM